MKERGTTTKEGRMSKRVGVRLGLLLSASLAAVVGLVSSGSALGEATQSCGTVALNEQA